ncbi:hypothetical protein [Bacillus pinisoli]|uniref:hypothetical protein n=1 Tax=Bacillus pinisoli TaxID=2901866 RepID=UPI001FF267C1|nr:hypothetical protein [Bacillus pinisoli]
MNRWMKGIILFYLSLLFFGSFIAVGMLWTGYLERILPFISQIEIFLYFFFAGAIGGSLRHLYMFCSHYMRGELTNYKEWVMYIFYPIFATGTAVISVTLIESGILFIEFTQHQDAPYAQICLAFFVGFGFNRFVDKLNRVSKQMFSDDKNSRSVQQD